jgi:hypothetical protein
MPSLQFGHAIADVETWLSDWAISKGEEPFAALLSSISFFWHLTLSLASHPQIAFIQWSLAVQNKFAG